MTMTQKLSGWAGEARKIGRTNVHASRLGMGAAAIGNLYQAVTDEEATGVVQEALGRGIGYIDTAPYYGHGLSERRVGMALAEAATRPVISTKVGRRLDPLSPGQSIPDFGFVNPDPFVPVFDYSGDACYRSIEGSLKRLGVDHIDIALVHDLGVMTHGVAHPIRLQEALNGVFPALAELKRQGVVGAIGIGVNEIAVAREVISAAAIDAVLLAGRYTLLDQSARDQGLFALCAEKGISLILGGPFNSGLLADPFAPSPTYDYVAAPSALVARAQVLHGLCRDHGIELGAAALAFCADAGEVAAIIPGVRSLAELHQITEWARMTIPQSFWTDFASFSSKPE